MCDCMLWELGGGVTEAVWELCVYILWELGGGVAESVWESGYCACTGCVCVCVCVILTPDPDAASWYRYSSSPPNLLASSGVRRPAQQEAERLCLSKSGV